jgi:RNA polymerase sigma factor (sigma-70 family)
MEFAETARRYLNDVYRYLLYLTGDRFLAEDLAADTVERAFRQRGRYDPKRGGERAWLLTMARSIAIDHYRREQRRQRTESEASRNAHAADRAGVSDDLGAALEDGLRALSASEREVIALRVILDVDGPATANQSQRLLDPPVPRTHTPRTGGSKPCLCLIP